MGWKEPEYSRSQVMNAGTKIRDSCADKDALAITDNWRASHAFPLQVIYCNLKRKCNGHDDIVAQRLKRLSSIVNKLEREPKMSLWTMQDLGGCRAILSDIDSVYRLVDLLKKSSWRHILKKENDYIKKPKDSGYRCYHMVYQYMSDKKETYNRNMLIEIQTRTHLQHLWATAVETMGLFTNQALKASFGEEDALRFFALVSSLFAWVEKTSDVPNTPSNTFMAIDEIKKLNAEHNYLEMLSAIRVAVSHVEEQSSRRSGYYMLKLNYHKNELKVDFYPKIDEATDEYNKIENDNNSTAIDAVLVSVSSFKLLKAAYPNYFSDINDFIKEVNKLLYLGGIDVPF